MPSLTSRASGETAVGELLVLVDEKAQSRVELSPRRGAIVTSFVVGERELLYLDGATLRDASKSVRGGIPLLFPSPGRLTGDRFTQQGRHGELPQHGFARTLPWTVLPGAADAARGSLQLASSPETLAAFPWAHTLTLTYALTGTRLRIALAVHNQDSEPLPYAFGLHPYFAVSDKQRARIDTQATRVFDNVSKQERAFEGFDLTAPELDLHLLDHGSSISALQLGDGTRLEVRGSHEYRRWVVWTLAGKDFVCLEPWTAPFDALNTGASLLHVAPGATHDTWVEITATSAAR